MINFLKNRVMFSFKASPSHSLYLPSPLWSILSSFYSIFFRVFRIFQKVEREIEKIPLSHNLCHFTWSIAEQFCTFFPSHLPKYFLCVCITRKYWFKVWNFQFEGWDSPVQVLPDEPGHWWSSNQGYFHKSPSVRRSVGQSVIIPLLQFHVPIAGLMSLKWVSTWVE